MLRVPTVALLSVLALAPSFAVADSPDTSNAARRFTLTADCTGWSITNSNFFVIAYVRTTAQLFRTDLGPPVLIETSIVGAYYNAPGSITQGKAWTQPRVAGATYQVTALVQAFVGFLTDPPPGTPANLSSTFGPVTLTCPVPANLPFTPAVDCSAWHATGNYATGAYLTADVVLFQDVGGVTSVVTSASGATVIPNGGSAFDLTANWAVALPQNVNLFATITLAAYDGLAAPPAVPTIPSATGSVTTAVFTCTPAITACPKTQGYWKTHENLWPITSMVLGNTNYTEAQCLVILNTPVGGDITIQLAHQLIAAKLNVANGAPTLPIAATILAADNYLMANPIGSNPKGATKTTGVTIKDALDAYNNNENCNF